MEQVSIPNLFVHVDPQQTCIECKRGNNVAVDSCRAMNHFLSVFSTLQSDLLFTFGQELVIALFVCRVFTMAAVNFLWTALVGNTKTISKLHECNHGSLCVFAAFAAVCDGKICRIQCLLLQCLSCAHSSGLSFTKFILALIDAENIPLSKNISIVCVLFTAPPPHFYPKIQIVGW